MTYELFRRTSPLALKPDLLLRLQSLQTGLYGPVIATSRSERVAGQPRHFDSLRVCVTCSLIFGGGSGWLQGVSALGMSCRLVRRRYGWGGVCVHPDRVRDGGDKMEAWSGAGQEGSNEREP